MSPLPPYNSAMQSRRRWMLIIECILVCFILLFAAWMAAGCTVASAPVAGRVANNSPTGLDSGIPDTVSGQFKVNAYFRQKYFQLLKVWEQRLRTEGNWPMSAEDGFTNLDGSVWLCRRDTMERELNMAQWTRDAEKVQ